MLQAHLLALDSGPVSLLSGLKMTIFRVKIPPIKQLLISIDFVVEQSDWRRSAAAAPKQKRTITMDDGSTHRPLRGSAQRQPGGAKVNAQGVRPCGTLR